MKTNPADVLVGLMMALLGLLGLLLAAHALDAEMYVFGLSLAAFSTAFDFGLIKAHYDAADRLRQAAVHGVAPVPSAAPAARPLAA